MRNISDKHTYRPQSHSQVMRNIRAASIPTALSHTARRWETQTSELPAYLQTSVTQPGDKKHKHQSCQHTYRPQWHSPEIRNTNIRAASIPTDLSDTARRWETQTSELPAYLQTSVTQPGDEKHKHQSCQHTYRPQSHSLVIRNMTIRAACIPTDLSHSQVMRNVRVASNRPVP